MGRNARAWLIAGAAGVALTVITGALAHFGAGTLAIIVGFPAVIWSNAAYALGLYPLTNGLLTAPVGLFCFATPAQALASHAISAFPPFTLTARVVILGVAWNRARLLARHTAA